MWININSYQKYVGNDRPCQVQEELAEKHERVANCVAVGGGYQRHENHGGRQQKPPRAYMGVDACERVTQTLGQETASGDAQQSACHRDQTKLVRNAATINNIRGVIVRILWYDKIVFYNFLLKTSFWEIRDVTCKRS